MKTPREVLLGQHRDVEPKLARMWPSVAAACNRRAETMPVQRIAWTLWCELILPSRRAWAGLACAWVVIVVLNLGSSKPATTEVVSRTKPPTHEEMRALIEQRRMLAQLIGPLSEPAHTQKRAAPGPHSERAPQTAAV